LGEYLVPVVIMSAVLGMISFLSYPSPSEKTVKFATTVLLLYTALTPLFSFASNLSGDSVKDYISGLEFGVTESEGEYEKVAEEAFKKGICKLLYTKYGIEEGSAEVYIYGFNFKNMKAEKIKILLCNKGAFSDFRSIEEYITEQGLGECEVNIKIG